MSSSACSGQQNEPSIPIATVTSVYMLRGDGGHGGFGTPPAPPDPPCRTRPPRPPWLDIASTAPKRPDLPPLGRSEPDPRRPGHGCRSSRLSTPNPAWSMHHGHRHTRHRRRASHEGDPARLTALSVRFSTPVFPGETLRIGDVPTRQPAPRFRARAVERDVVVLDRGSATIAVDQAWEESSFSEEKEAKRLLNLVAGL